MVKEAHRLDQLTSLKTYFDNIDLQAPSQNFYSSHQCLCGVDAPLADHLRANKPCVQMLRGEPKLEMGGSNDDFILKATLLLKGCPVPSCDGEHHREDLPNDCLLWWRETGWTRMGWKGTREAASSAIIKKKISTFCKNFHLRKKNSNTQPEHQHQQHTQENNLREEASEASTGNQRGVHSRDPSCFNCLYHGFLPSHLEESHHCLTAHLKKHLGHRADKYRGKARLAIFDLGLVLNFCLNSRCTYDTRRGNTRCSAHVQSTCLEVYQREGERLLQWEQGLDASTI